MKKRFFAKNVRGGKQQRRIDRADGGLKMSLTCNVQCNSPVYAIASPYKAEK
jgi:hypothetical protein